MVKMLVAKIPRCMNFLLVAMLLLQERHSTNSTAWGSGWVWIEIQYPFKVWTCILLLGSGQVWPHSQYWALLSKGELIHTLQCGCYLLIGFCEQICVSECWGGLKRQPSPRGLIITRMTKKVTVQHGFICLVELTLDSHAMPAIEIPSRQVTVMTPMMRMSLVRSTMTAPFSWGRKSREFSGGFKDNKDHVG